jgi:hypothetical protein
LRRLLACLALAALVFAATALAGPGDPKQAFTPADQKRAKASVLRQSDVDPNFKPSPDTPDSGSDEVPCKVLDMSDLTLTGRASSEFKFSVFTISSSARVYETLADANAFWRRTTSKAGQACLRKQARDAFTRSGATVLSLARIPFPKLTPRSFAMRLVVRIQGVKVYFDFVDFQHSRAHVSSAFISPRYPFGTDNRLRPMRLLASRTKAAMG